MKIDMLIVLMVGMMLGANLAVVILAFLGANDDSDNRCRRNGEED